MLCFKIPRLLIQNTHLGEVQLFLSQSSCMEVPLCEIWQQLQEKNSCPSPWKMRSVKAAPTWETEVSRRCWMSEGQGEVGLQPKKKRWKGINAQAKNLWRGREKEVFRNQDTTSSNMEMPATEIRERRIMKPKGFKVCSCTEQHRSGLSCSL